MWGWTIKKAEDQRIDTFELGCSKEIKQSILKEINPEYSLEGLKLKLQYFGHLMRRANLLQKTLMLGKIEGRRRSGQKTMQWSGGITHSTNMSLSKFPERVKEREAGILHSMGSQRVGHDLAIEWLQKPGSSWILNAQHLSSSWCYRKWPQGGSTSSCRCAFFLPAISLLFSNGI